MFQLTIVWDAKTYGAGDAGRSNEQAKAILILTS
jgi:hypothetical protein